MNAKPNTQKVKTLRILIAEDEARDADLLERELRREGMQIEARRVETREAFLRELMEFRPDIVLSDYGMPSFDGMTALRLTREHAPDTPFIMVTGSLSEETAVDCIKAGADDYLLKDRRSRLPSAVKAALHKVSLEREKREAEEAMRLSAREWRTTFDAMADLVCVLGPDRTIQRCNRAFREFVGRDWTGILGKTCCELLHHGGPGTGTCPSLSMMEKRKTFSTDVQLGGRWFRVNVDPLLAEDGYLLGAIYVMTDVTEQRQVKAELQKIEWLLTPAPEKEDGDAQSRYRPTSCGDLTALNTTRLILDSVGADVLANVADECLRLLGTSAAIYEKNGDYALRILESGWCRRLDEASRQLCDTEDNRAALDSGKWIFHETQWTRCARLAVERGETADVAMASGIHIYAVPIRAHSEVIGAACFSYGSPTLDEEVLKKIGALFHVAPQELAELAAAYPSRPPYIIEQARARLRSVACLIGEIVERRLVERALQESHEKYRSMVDNIGIGVSLISPDLRVLEMNAQMHTWFPDVRPGGPLPCYTAFNNPPRKEPCSYCPTIKTLADGQVHEAITDTPAGNQVRNYRVVASPVRDASGRVVAAIEMFEDITDRLLLEAQFRQAQKMEAVGQLAGGVAHDFNNILTGLMGYTRLQLDNAPKGSELFQDLTEVVELSQRAANLTRQLLAFSRRQTLLPQILDLNRVVEDITKMLGRLIGEDVDLRFVPGPQLEKIKADPGQVEQVLMNLAVNARDAMPQGGQLTIETCNVVLDQHYVENHLDALPGAYVQITVTDTGCGMSKETLQHIFEPFFTTKEVGKGTGLGLATTFGIVKQHNGSIQVYSEVGRGTTFRVYLPVTTEAANGALRQATAKASGGNETILVVEDEEAVREIAKRILTQHGYTVLTAANGAKAEALFGEHRDGIALVLTDVIMPGTSGRELAERLRLLSPSLRVLFMSGYSDNAVFRHGVLGEGMAFIGKPFAQEDLLLAVRKVLDTA